MEKSSTLFDVFLLMWIASQLRVNTLSGIRTSFVGIAMERSYRACQNEGGEQNYNLTNNMNMSY